MTDFAEIAGLHGVQKAPGGGFVCEYCGQPWPCDTTLVHRMVERIALLHGPYPGRFGDACRECSNGNEEVGWPCRIYRIATGEEATS